MSMCIVNGGGLMTAQMLISVLGGLGLFILGMNMMSEGLQRAAGDKLRRILELLTFNRYIAVVTGIIITVLVQSSSATTVMVVGFVNAGLMTLTRAVGTILGANIGTTITAQIVAFKISEIALPAIAVGVLMSMFVKKRVYRNLGQAILGFGLLFLGITIMGSFEPLSLHDAIYNDSTDPLYLMDQIRDVNNDDNSWMQRLLLKEALEKLSPREKEILHKRFFVGMTQVQVAASIGISQAQVSRLEKGALRFIKEHMGME